MGESLRWVVGLVFAIALAFLLIFVRGEPDHGGPKVAVTAEVRMAAA